MCEVYEQMSLLYNNVERKREIVAGLQGLQDFQLKAAESLDSKAWNILNVTSATFGIVSAILSSLVSDKTPALFWLGLVAVLGLYLIQVYTIFQAIKPIQWFIVPGAEPVTRYDTLMNKYIASENLPLTEDEYLNQLIADYAGNLSIKDGETTVFGSIQKIEANNRRKADSIRMSALLIGIIIATLIGLSFALSIIR